MRAGFWTDGFVGDVVIGSERTHTSLWRSGLLAATSNHNEAYFVENWVTMFNVRVFSIAKGRRVFTQMEIF